MTRPIPTPVDVGAYSTVIAYPTPGPAGRDGRDGAPGPRGAQGPPGPASSGPALYTGQGAPPTFIEGARPGDAWLDTITGNTYRLD